MSPLVWLLLALLALCAFCVLAYIAYANEVAIGHARIEGREAAALSAAGDLIADTLQDINHDLLKLAHDPLLHSAINAPSQISRDALAAHWQSYSRSRGIYDKIRWLDEHGKERVRINYNNGDPLRVPDDKLQSRALRYFFKDTLLLARDEIYVSPLDLNVEGEAIELPYKPTLRIATPVFDENGERRGILLLNYLGGDLFNRLSQAAAEVATRLWLLNSEGYWLHSNQPDDEWGFMFGRTEQTLGARHPQAWQRINAESNGQYLDNDGLWTHATVHPLLEGQVSSAGSNRVFSPSRDRKSIDGYYWKVVSLIPRYSYDVVARGLAGTNFVTRLGHQLLRLQKRLIGLHHARLSVGAQGSLHEHLAAQVYEQMSEGVMIVDARARVLMVNPAFTQITGYSAAEAVGKPASARQASIGTDHFKQVWAQVLMTGTWQGEASSRRKNGEVFTKWLSFSAIRNGSQQVSHYIGVFSDITQVKASAERMEYFAHHDTLTGLPNRRLLTARLEHSIQLAQREGRQFALLFIDLDHFKAVNDQCGHAAGDELLKEVTSRLSGVLRAEDTLARLGGDEFVVLLENIGNPEHTNRVCDTILSRFPCIANTPAGTRIEVTASIGISFFPRDGDTPATLLGTADHAMYQAKQSGRNGIAHSKHAA